MCLDRAGLVGEDGPTHHGAFDLAYMRCVPNLIVASPYNEYYLRHLMYTATYGNDGPFVIRYPRGQGELIDWECEMKILKIGKGRKLKDGEGVAVVSIGPIGNTVRKAIYEVEKEGFTVAHYDAIFLKPIDEEMLTGIAQKHKKIVTVENGVITGGLGSAVLEFLSDNHYHDIDVTRIGLPDEFVTHGSVKDLNRLYEIDEEGITKRLLSVLKHN